MIATRSSRPRNDVSARAAPRWIGIGTLLVAAALILSLGPLRARFGGVRDLGWFALLATLLASGGATSAMALSAAPTRLKPHRLLGRCAMLLGGPALVFGAVSTSATRDWSDGARAIGALAFGAALAILAFGIVLLWRSRPASACTPDGDGVEESGAGAS